MRKRNEDYFRERGIKKKKREKENEGERLVERERKNYSE